MKNVGTYCALASFAFCVSSACNSTATKSEATITDTVSQNEIPSNHPATESPVDADPVTSGINTDSLAPKLIGQMILDGKLKPADNKYTYRMMDSLQTSEKAARPFYFKVFNKIMDHADGALGEAVGDYALTYVEQYPSEFIRNISTLPTYRFETWASQVGIELFLSANDAEDNYQKFASALINNCKGCDAATIKKLRNFNQLVWQTMQQNLQPRE